MSHYEAPIREPLIIGDKSYHDISNDIAAPIEGKANRKKRAIYGRHRYVRSDTL